MPINSSRFFKDLPDAEEMRQAFSDETRVAHFLRIEIAQAKVEAALGIIPRQAYEQIALRAPNLKINWERLRRDVEIEGYPVPPFLGQLAETCGSASEYLHWGSATADVNDTAFVLQLHEGIAIVERDARRVHASLLRLAESHRSMAGVSTGDGPHARPMTFSFRCAMWLTELQRYLERLARMRAALVSGQFAGTVATLAALGERGLEAQRALMVELGLEVPAISWFASRDRLTDVTFVLATLSAGMANIARTLLDTARKSNREAGDVAHIDHARKYAGQHRRHVAGCELIMVHARMASQNAAMVMESMVQDHESDRQEHFESVVVPQTFQLAHAAVEQLALVLAELEGQPSGFQGDIDRSRGLVMADSVAIRLALKCGRRTAHRLVSRACDAAQQENSSLREALLGDREISSRLSAEEIDEALDPANYLGCGPSIVEQVIAGANSSRA